MSDKKKPLKKGSFRFHKGDSYYESEPSRNKKANKIHPRSEQSKHKRDFIDPNLL